MCLFGTADVASVGPEHVGHDEVDHRRPGLAGRTADVRQQDDVVTPHQRVRHSRLGLEGVQTGAGDASPSSAATRAASSTIEPGRR
jgi:hypothetical protein